MTLQIPPSIGDPARVSPMFAVKANNQDVETVFTERFSFRKTKWWFPNAIVALAMAKFGRDEDVEVKIHRVDDEPITRVRVFPEWLREVAMVGIVAGDVIMQLATGAVGPNGESIRGAYVVIEDETTELLSIEPGDLDPVIPPESVDLGAILGAVGNSFITLSEGGTYHWTPGYHEQEVELQIRVARDVRIITPLGAWTAVNYDLGPVHHIGTPNIRNVTFEGGGIVSGEWFPDPYPHLEDFETTKRRAMFFGEDGVVYGMTNVVVRGLTMIRHSSFPGWWSVTWFDKCWSHNPWVWGVGGYTPMGDFGVGMGLLSKITDCFGINIDDVTTPAAVDGTASLVERCYAICCGTHNILEFHSRPDDGLTHVMRHCGSMQIGVPYSQPNDDIPEFNQATCRIWVSALPPNQDPQGNSQEGFRNVTVIDCYEDDENNGGSVGFENHDYPFAVGPAATGNGSGQIRNVEVIRLRTSRFPSSTHPSRVMGKDANNTVSGIVFRDCIFGTSEVEGGILLRNENRPVFIRTNAFASISIQNTEDLPMFVVEDGTGLANANALASVAFVDQYALDFESSSNWAASTQPQKEDAIREMTRWVNLRRSYLGRKAKQTQGCQFPRTGLLDEDKWPVDPLSVPSRVQQAVAYGAIRIRAGDWTPFPDESRDDSLASSSFSVGSISFSDTYKAKRQDTETNLPIVDQLLAPFCSPNGTVRKVLRS